MKCNYEHCTKSSQKRGYCLTHYSRVKRDGTLPGDFPICTIPNCLKRVESHGYCQTHLARWLRSGDALYKQPTGFKFHQGYILLRCPDHPYADKRGYVKFHRLIKERELGRYLTPFEDVHHRDENKANNAPSNLEVVTGSGHAIRHATKYSDDDLREEIRRIHNLLGHPATQTEFRHHSKIAIRTIILRFGRWNTAVGRKLRRIKSVSSEMHAAL